MDYEKTYLVTGTRLESKDMAVLELLDEASSPNAVKSIVVRITPSDYAGLNVPIGSKVKVTISPVPEAAPPKA